MDDGDDMRGSETEKHVARSLSLSPKRIEQKVRYCDSAVYEHYYRSRWTTVD